MIRKATDADRIPWDAYVSAHPHGLAYQYWGWLEAVASAYRFEGVRFLAENAGIIHGILSLVHVKRPLGKGALVSLPYCDVGGPLTDAPEVETALVEKALAFARRIGVKKIEIRAAKAEAGCQEDIDGYPDKVRMLLQLPENSNKLLSGFKAKLRSQIRKPQKDGLTAELGGPNLLDAFYDVFRENMRDLGSPVHSRKWIGGILTSYGDRAIVGIVRMPDGTPAAGGLILRQPTTVSIPWASSLRRFNRWNPNMLLYWEFLKCAADGGSRFFDFGRSTPDGGTYRFKKQWGATPTPLYWSRADVPKRRDEAFHLDTVSVSSGSGHLRRWGERVIQHFPLPVSEVIGSATRKYISL